MNTSVEPKLTCVRLFRSFSEIECLESYHQDTYITLQNFKRLIGHYKFDTNSMIPCKVQKTNGSVCHTKHFNGWVAETNDGAINVIGRDCAKRDFGGDDNAFSQQVTRYNRQLQFETALNQLKRHLQSKESIKKQALALQKSLKDIEVEIKILKNDLPASVNRKLLAMLSSQNFDVNVVSRTVKEEKSEGENPKKEVHHTPIKIGTLRVPNAWAKNYTKSLHSDIEDILQAITSASSLEKSTTKINRWNKSFAKLNVIHNAVDNHRAQLNNFLHADNLHLFSILVKSHQERKEASRTVARLTKQDFPNNPNEYLTDVERQIKTHYKITDLLMAD